MLQVTFHKVVEAEVEAASRGASANEVAHMTGQPENARLITLLKGGALSVTIKKGSAKQRPGVASVASQPDLANQVCMLVFPCIKTIILTLSSSCELGTCRARLVFPCMRPQKLSRCDCLLSHLIC